jgi:uroporphyrinogen-III synthase
MQKYMELRKRRIFWGQGTLDDLKTVLKRFIEGKFLLPASDTIKEKVIGILDALNAQYTAVDIYKTVPEKITDIKPENYDAIVFFTPIAAESLKKNFPNFKQNKTRFAAYSIITANRLKELGYRVDIYAPTIEFPSMVNAIAHYLLHIDKK